MSTIIDTDAEPCMRTIIIDGKATACGCTTLIYSVGGRQVSRECGGKCGSVVRIDVTRGHAMKRWNRETIRAWWAKVYG